MGSIWPNKRMELNYNKLLQIFFLSCFYHDNPFTKVAAVKVEVVKVKWGFSFLGKKKKKFNPLKFF